MTGAICTLCGRPGAAIQAGGDVGPVHQACFDRWDRLSEANERTEVLVLASIPLRTDTRRTRRAA